MILVDTSVWIDHLRTHDRTLADLLESGQVLGHPFVIGEIALGRLRQRDIVLDALQNLPRTAVATDREVLGFIERYALAGSGIGYIDAHLLAAARLMPGTLLWTRDKPLSRAADRLGLAAAPSR
ncbi:MAG: type II toxin-antitoxin system VapC family toxin [Rhodospirillales bacterium]